MNGRNRHRKVPIVLCCHHKVGTTLLLKVFDAICKRFGWRFLPAVGCFPDPPMDADVILFLHSLVRLEAINEPFTGAHFIRDPRDVIVSGYLYHLRCDEQWCTNKDLEPRSPIQFPQVPYSQQHRPDEWKRAYLRSLGGRSYQEHLRALDESEGLLFEMRNYGGWTVEQMVNWDYSNPHMLEVRFETLMNSYDATFRTLFERFGFSQAETVAALEIAAKHDLARMSDAEAEAIDQVSSRETTKWRKYFHDVHKQEFKRRFGDALVRLGYEASDQW